MQTIQQQKWLDTYVNMVTCMDAICDRACEIRACGLKYTMSFDETNLNTEMYYLDSASNVAKPNKLLINLENFVAVPYWNKKL